MTTSTLPAPPARGAGRAATIHLCCAADGTYVPHAAAMIRSVLAHSGRYAVHAHYLHGGELDRRSMDVLRAMVEEAGGTISFVEFRDPEMQALPFNNQSSVSTWYRMALPDLLPETDRVLYLDADAIVVESLEPLWELDLAGNLVGAVTNVLPPDSLGLPAALGLPTAEAYFNAGVLLFDLSRMRSEGTAEALRECSLRRGPALQWHDQDVLNLVLGGRRLPLHPRWNLMNAMLSFEWAADVLGGEALEEALRQPAIRHFEGPRASKPWHYLCEQPHREAYFEHRSQTPWPTCDVEGVTARNRSKRIVREVLRVAPARWDRATHAPPPLWKRLGRR